VRAFAILCHYLGHTPLVDVFLYFFEAKSPGQKVWVSFNGIVGRVLLTLFQQSYKGFKKHFFKVRCKRGTPLSWTGSLFIGRRNPISGRLGAWMIRVALNIGTLELLKTTL